MRRLLAIVFSAFWALSAAPALAQGRFGLGTTASQAGYTAASGDPNAVLATAINAVLATIGVVFVILLVYAGILYLTAQGESEKVEKAKRIISAALIGTVIVVLAYAAVTYLFKILTFSQVTPEEYQQVRQRSIDQTCTSAEACGLNGAEGDPICYGEAICDVFRNPGTVVEDPCLVDAQGVECQDQQFSELKTLCDADPSNPLCDSLPSHVIPTR